METPVARATMAPTAATQRWHQHRYVEIDTLRGVAVLMMVIYHLMFDLNYFGVTDAVFTNPFWFYFQRVTASLFIVLVGVSLTLSVRQSRRQRVPERAIFKRLVGRGLRIFAWGMLVTLVTGLVFGPQLAVRFGILHFLGVATILAWPCLRLKWFNLLAWIALLLAGHWVQTVTAASAWWIWLGFQPTNYVYVDYFPLMPWFGVLLLGLFLGNLLYPEGQRRFPLTALAVPPTAALSFLGRHSLVIYLVHQPALIGLLLVFSGLRP